ncbi:hypothetical protein GGI35DRAFT_88497 [Trichoderma velutinum]
MTVWLSCLMPPVWCIMAGLFLCHHSPASPAPPQRPRLAFSCLLASPAAAVHGVRANTCMRFFGSGTKATRSEAAGDALWAFVLVPSVPVASMPHPAGWPCRTKHVLAQYQPAPTRNAQVLVSCQYPTPRHSPRARFLVQSLQVSRDPVVRWLRWIQSRPPWPPVSSKCLVWCLVCRHTPASPPSTSTYLR